MQYRGAVGEDEGGEDVERALLRSARQRAEDDGAPLLAAHFDDRRPLDLLFVDKIAEHRRLQDAQPDPQADADQHDRKREWDAPAPDQELIARPVAEDQHREIGEAETGRSAELRP